MQYMSQGLNLYLYQVQINTFAWEEGPRLGIYLKFFPVFQNGSSHLFNKSEVVRIRRMFTGWKIFDSDLFGPYELLNFTLLEPYREGQLSMTF